MTPPDFDFWFSAHVITQWVSAGLTSMLFVSLCHRLVFWGVEWFLRRIH